MRENRRVSSRTATLIVSLTLLAAGLPSQAQEIFSLWRDTTGHAATPAFDDLPNADTVEIETPLPGGSSPSWEATRSPLPNGFRLTSREGTDYLVISVTEVVTGVIGVGGTHYVVTGDAQAIVVTETEPFEGDLPLAPPARATLEQPVAADGVLDVLVLYTPDAAVEAGGTAAIEQSLADFMTATQGFFDAGALGVVSASASIESVSDNESSNILRTLIELTYVEGSSEYLSYDPGAQVEKFDAAHCRRGESGADLVMLVTGQDTTNAAGIAWILSESTENRDLAFAVTEWAFGPLVFAHELGHLLGNDHDEDNDSPGASRKLYSHGYRVPGVGRTIMAYPCEIPFGEAACPPLGIFSDPDIQHQGYNIGNLVNADASRSLSESWEDYAGWEHNDSPTLGEVTVTVDRDDPGRYQVTAAGRDTTSCSGVLRVDPGDGSPVVVETWESASAPFAVGVDLHFTEPAGLTIGVCLRDVQGLENCDIDPPIEVDVCHASGFFNDVSSQSQFDEDIGWAACQEITEGFPDGGFHPGAPITRASIAAFLYRLESEPFFVPPDDPSFSDVPKTHPFFTEIEWLVAEGITTGYPDRTYRPGAGVSRVAMAAFIYRLSGEPDFSPPGSASFTDVPITHPFFTEIEWLVLQGITSGYSDGTFRPQDDVARRAMAAFLHRFALLES